ncbi:Cof-type HAD-IIB family hydrolase [Utexia brackfieldae]|uniref:Cof-type HAD-IIB family hydrolase n=1 Tax=Utexia brackfieldae TaxID=3074108 RepID=UPI00370D19BD
MYKLIACDMDETLLDEQAQVSQQNRDAIAKARAAGVRFVLASGRGFPAMQTTAQILGMANQTDEYMISFNGGAITENRGNRIIALQALTFEQVKTLFQIGLAYDVGFHIYTTESVFMYRINQEERTYVEGRLDGYIELTSPDIDFLKDHQLIKILFHNNERHYLEQIKQHMPAEIVAQLSLSFSGNRYLEFNQKGVSKGNALRFLAEKLNIKPTEIITIGDNNNDISMLSMAGLGIAVLNATADAKAAADYICSRDHTQSAIADVINRFVLNA